MRGVRGSTECLVGAISLLAKVEEEGLIFAVVWSLRNGTNQLSEFRA